MKDEDAAILANTYVPGDSPKNEKSNKKRDKTLGRFECNNIAT